jgi:tellurite methyltransferase
MDEKNIEFNKNYWDSFYTNNQKHTPSQFCVCVLTEIEPETVIVELGSGNGRDSHYFASQGHITIAMDLSHQAIKSCKELAASRNTEHSTFFQGNLANEKEVSLVIMQAREQSGNATIAFFSRFVMHSMDEDEELAFLATLSRKMLPGESIYFEFRSKEDAELKKYYGGHYRRYIDTEKFKQLLSTEFGFDITYSITGRGMAKYKEEDPFVSRIIARKV